jgi:hypothetical protein
MNKQASTILVACFALVTAGCTSKINYDTHPDAEGLRGLRGRPVLLVQFDYKDDLLVYDEPLEESLGRKVADQQKASFINQFGSLFLLRDASGDVVEKYGKNVDLSNKEVLSRILREFGGNGAVVVTVAYGFKMASGSMKDKLEEEALHKVLPKKAVGILTGPSQVESYDFASNTTLLNKEGRAVWSFYGKASTMPTFSSMFTPAEFARSVAGLDPSAQNLLLKMVQIGDAYNQYLSWLMQQDFNGEQAKNYFRDCPSDRKNKYVQIFPAENKTYVPFVKGYNPLQ